MKGVMKLSKANVKWFYQLRKLKMLENLESYKFERYMLVDKKDIILTNLTIYIKRNYEMIINHKRFHLSNFKNVIKLMNNLKK